MAVKSTQVFSTRIVQYQYIFPLHQYNFEGRYDIVKFIREIQAQGLYVSLRIGPFIEAEWKYGYECTKSIFTCICSSIRLIKLQLKVGTFDLKTIHICNKSQSSVCFLRLPSYCFLYYLPSLLQVYA
jgi:hypothetical protein